MTNTLKSWAHYEQARRALQQFSPKFTRAEFCRRAGIADTTMFKGLKAAEPKEPSRRKAGSLKRELGVERARLAPTDRERLDLVLAAEGIMIEEGLR